MSPPPPPSSGLTEPRFRDALRNLPGRVWVISFGILVNQLGNFLPVFIVLYLTGRGHSAGAAGLVLGMAGVGKVLGNALGGHLADSIGRRWTIVLSALTTAGLIATVPLVERLSYIVLVVGLIGVTSQVYRPAAAAVLIDSVPATNQDRLAAFGVFRFAMNVGAALGGVIGGVLASTSYMWACSGATRPRTCSSGWSWRYCSGMRRRHDLRLTRPTRRWTGRARLPGTARCSPTAS